MAIAKKMKKRNSNRSGTSRTRPVYIRCYYCVENREPHYLDTNLTKYITEKGKIIPQTRTGLCHTHQRLTTREVKKARYLALMPFTTAVR